jgi:O-antigen biosynthesis protein
MTTDEPRLEWTGERYLPGRGGVQIALEHQHRYRFAAALLGGRSVLDAASGEGYGSHLLAEAGAQVTGLEIDPATVDHARRRYPDVDVQLGDVTDLPFPDARFDAVVSFETIEHVAEPVHVIAEFLRVLVPGGLLVLSTPNAPGAPDAAIEVNRFHRAELDESALRELLAPFELVAVVPQRILGMSVLGPPGPGLALGTLGDDADAGEPRFLIAVARKPGPGGDGHVHALPVPSGLVEPGGDLIAEYAGWLREGQAEARSLARAKEELHALHEDQGRRFLELEETARAVHAEGLAHRDRADGLAAEVDVLRAANARLIHDYDELAETQTKTLAALAAASAALRAIDGRSDADE